MKKVILLGTIALFVFSLTSCSGKKETITTEESVVYTDAPPKEIWDNTQIYLQTDHGYITEADLPSVTLKANACNGYYDPNTGQMQYYQCGSWYTVAFYKYWGTYKGRIYISKSKETGAVFGEVLLRIQDALVRKKDTKLFVSFYGDRNPLGARNVVYGITP